MAMIGVVGGTGKLGAALAGRWAKAGHQLLIGSRNIDSAAATARDLSKRFGMTLGAGTNLDVATRAEIVVTAVPWSAQEACLGEIRAAVAGKILIDTTVPLMPPKVMRVQLPPEGSAALKAQALLGGEVRLVSAFHNVAAHKLAMDADVACDVLVFSDDKEARAIGVSLVRMPACAACTAARSPTRPPPRRSHPSSSSSTRLIRSMVPASPSRERWWSQREHPAQARTKRSLQSIGIVGPIDE